MADSDNRHLGRSSSVERIILLNANSTLITEGPPERRLLITSEEEIGEHGSIRRWTFGVKKPQKIMRTILMLGETGTGKSTLINAMTTYILGVEWSDNVRYEIVKAEGRDQSESQTSQVTVYEIFGHEDVRVPFSLRIIDTPGYGDTEGKKIDKCLGDGLRKLFQHEDGVHQIDAVCLVVRASQNRLTHFQSCIFDAVLSLFGKDMEKNIIPVFTFAGVGKPAALAAIKKFDFHWSRDKKDNPVHFCFDNAPEDEDDEDTSADFKVAWEKRERSMQAFFRYLNTLETRSQVMSHAVLMSRDELQCCVKSLQDRIVQAEHKQNEIRQTQEAWEKHKKEREENNNFEYEVEESYVSHVKSDNNATCCKKCKFTCHHPCSIWSDIFFWCAVTRFKNCISCPNKCSLSDHVTEGMIYVPSVRKVTRTFVEMKEKYDKSGKNLQSLQIDLQKALNELENEKQMLIFKSYDHVIRLQEISLRPESLSIFKNIDFLIKKLGETKQNEKVQKLEDMRRRAMKAHNIEGEGQSVLMKCHASLHL